MPLVLHAPWAIQAASDFPLLACKLLAAWLAAWSAGTACRARYSCRRPAQRGKAASTAWAPGCTWLGPSLRLSLHAPWPLLLRQQLGSSSWPLLPSSWQPTAHAPETTAGTQIIERLLPTSNSSPQEDCTMMQAMCRLQLQSSTRHMGMVRHCHRSTPACGVTRLLCHPNRQACAPPDHHQLRSHSLATWLCSAGQCLAELWVKHC